MSSTLSFSPPLGYSDPQPAPHWLVEGVKSATRFLHRERREQVKEPERMMAMPMTDSIMNSWAYLLIYAAKNLKGHAGLH